MFFEMALLAKLGGRKLVEVFDPDIPGLATYRGWFAGRSPGKPVVVALMLVVVGAVMSVTLGDRQERVPAHVALNTFPLDIGDWKGSERTIGAAELDVLKLTDYTVVNYVNARDAAAVELYIAYYGSQRKGNSVHSPRACLPGSGWRFDNFEQVGVPEIQADGAPLPVNRVLMSMGEDRLLVYYWFMQRGRNVTSEYSAKWYIFWDSITKRRTDGALVRLVTSVADVSQVPAAEARLNGFLRQVYPSLYYYIPQADAVPASPSPADLLNRGSATP